MHVCKHCLLCLTYQTQGCFQLASETYTVTLLLTALGTERASQAGQTMSFGCIQRQEQLNG